MKHIAITQPNGEFTTYVVVDEDDSTMTCVDKDNNQITIEVWVED